MKKFSLIFLVICWSVMIMIFFVWPMPETNYIAYEVEKISIYDKLVHIVLFGVFTYLVILAGFSFKKNYFIISLTSFVLSFNYIILGEYVQAFVPGRNPTYPDLFAGLLGTLIAIIFGYIMHCSPKQKLVLHVCCGSCASWVVKILRKDFNLILYFYNPGIYPEAEYDLRLCDAKKIARKYWGINLIEGTYNHPKWKKLIKGHEGDKEGGMRCELCYKERLEQTAKLAKKLKAPFFATTLSISPHKKTKVINKIGDEIAEKFNLLFYGEDFKAKNGFKKSVILSKKMKLHRQDYCGCEYSIRIK